MALDHTSGRRTRRPSRNTSQPDDGSHARGVSPDPMVEEQPGAKASPQPSVINQVGSPQGLMDSFTQGVSQAGRFQDAAYGALENRRRLLHKDIDPTNWSGTEKSLQERYGSNLESARDLDLSGRDLSMSPHDRTAFELLNEEVVQQVAGGVVESLREQGDTANEFVAWIDSLTGGLGDGNYPIPSAGIDKETGKFGINIDWRNADTFFGSDGLDLFRAMTPDFVEPTTVVGGMVKGVSQFVTGYAGLGRFAPVKHILRETAKDSWKKKLVTSSLKGAAVDSLMFDPHDANAVDSLNVLLEDYPMLQNPVFDYLESDPTDSSSEARFKKALEGLGLGLAAEGLFFSLKHMKAGGSNFLAKRKLSKQGFDIDNPVDEIDMQRHAMLDDLEAQKAKEEAERVVDVDETELSVEEQNAQLDAAGETDRRSARREGRSRAIQGIMDKYGVTQVEAEDWFNSKLEERVLPRLQALESEAAIAGREVDIDAVEASYKKLFDDIREGREPELKGLPKTPVLSIIKGLGGVATHRLNGNGLWVHSELYKHFLNADITAKRYPGLFRDPRKKGSKRLSKRQRERALAEAAGDGTAPSNAKKASGVLKTNAPPMTELDQVAENFTDSPYVSIEGADSYGRPDPDRMWEAILDDTNGTPRRTEEQTEAILEATLERRMLSDTLDDAGIDLNVSTNREAAEALHRNYDPEGYSQSVGDERLVATVSSGPSQVPKAWTEVGPHPDRPSLTESPGRLEDRPGWELPRAQEAELQGVPEWLIAALERVPQATETGRLLPRATPEQMEQLTRAGFLDEAGELTAKGQETLDARTERLLKFRDAARQGQRVDAGAARDFPIQIGRAYRYKMTVKPSGKPKKPGKDPADDLSVSDLQTVEEQILNERRTWDEARGEYLMDDVRDFTEQMIDSETNARVNSAVLELFRAGGVTRDPGRKLFEQMAELLMTRRVPADEIVEILNRNDLDWTDFASMWATDKSRIARQLGALGNLERAIRRGQLSKKARAELQIKLKDPNLPAKEKADIEELLNETRILTKEETLMLSEYGTDPGIIEGLGTWRRLENIRRGMLVSQIATAMRNGMTQGANLSMAMVQEGFEHAIKFTFDRMGMTRQAEAIHPIRAMETLLNVVGRVGRREGGGFEFRHGELGERLKSWDSEGTEFVDNLLSIFPKERDLLTSSFNADIISSGIGSGILKQVEDLALMLNTFNRFQEDVWRRATFKAEIGRQVKKYGVLLDDGSVYRDIDELEADGLLGHIPQSYMRNSVEKALDMTWAKQFQEGRSAKEGHRWATMDAGFSHLIKFVNAVPPLSWVMPFPRFMANSFQWMLNHSPVGMAEALMSPRGRRAMADGDYSGVSEGMVGFTMYAAAGQLVDSYGTDKWNEVLVPNWVADRLGVDRNSPIDIRAYQPFAAYYFAAWTVDRWRKDPAGFQAPSYTDLTQGLIGTNVRAGLGLYVIDQVMEDLARSGTAGSKTGSIVGNVAGNILASYAVPLNQLWDLQKSFDQWSGEMETSKVRDFSAPQNAEGMPLGHGMSNFEGGVANFKHALKGQFLSRVPSVASKESEVDGTFFREYPEVQLSTTGKAPASYAPFIKFFTGMTFKDPPNVVQKETARLGFTQSDILPSSGTPLWDNLVKEYMGPAMDAGKITDLLNSKTYKEDWDTPQQVQMLRIFLRAARQSAIAQASSVHPMLAKEVRENGRADYREQIFIKEGAWRYNVDSVLEHQLDE